MKKQVLSGGRTAKREKQAGSKGKTVVNKTKSAIVRLGNGGFVR